MLSDMVYENTCRICLKNDGFINIFHGDNNEKPPIEIIAKFINSLDFKISPDDKLPESICLKCYGLLHTFDDLLNTIKTSNILLRKFLRNKLGNKRNPELIITKLDNYDMLSYEQPVSSLSNDNSISSYKIEMNENNDNFIIESNCGVDADNEETFFELSTDIEYCDNSSEFDESIKEIHEYLCGICLTNFTNEFKFNEHLKDNLCFKKESNVDEALSTENSEINFNHSIINEKNESSDIRYVVPNNEMKSQTYEEESGSCAESPQYSQSSRMIKYQCEICKEYFRTNFKLWAHRKSKHEDMSKWSNVVEKYKCPFCPRIFTLLETLKQHGKLHNKIPLEESKHVCQECNISFKRADHLKMHQNGFHLKKFSFPCDHESCSKSFITNWARNKHYKKAHSNNINIFKCKTCPKVYKSSSALKRHEKIHQEKSGIQCNICKNFFARSDILREHLISHKIDEKKKQELIDETYDLIAKFQNKKKIIKFH